MMALYNKIYFIGFMGSGKSTTGKKLAASMGWSFIDLDKKIEEETGKTIPEIFSYHGEDYFRKVEAEVLRSLKSHKETIIATGGGAPCHSDNMSFMLETGLTVYLKLTPIQLKDRLSGSKTERPLIKGLSSEELLSFIEKKLVIREGYYSQAIIQINDFDVDHTLLQSLVKRRINPPANPEGLNN